MSEFNLPDNLDNTLPEQLQNNDYIIIIKNAISKCASDISKVSDISKNIIAQNGWDAYWKKGENIRTVACNLVTVSSVQQGMLDMVMLLISAAGRTKSDYNVILKSIDELSKSHAGNIEVLEYLVKIKNTVNEIKRRDELLDSLITYSNELRNSIKDLNNYFRSEIRSILQSAEELNNQHKDISEELSALKIFNEEERKYNRDKFDELFKDIKLKNKFVLETYNNLENSFQSKLDSISADQLKNYTELNKNINQQIEDVVNIQEIINGNLNNRIKNIFKITIISIIVFSLLIAAIIIYK